MTVHINKFNKKTMNGPLTKDKKYLVEGDCSTHYQIRNNKRKLIWINKHLVIKEDKSLD